MQPWESRGSAVKLPWPQGFHIFFCEDGVQGLMTNAVQNALVSILAMILLQLLPDSTTSSQFHDKTERSNNQCCFQSFETHAAQ